MVTSLTLQIAKDYEYNHLLIKAGRMWGCGLMIIV